MEISDTELKERIVAAASDKIVEGLWQEGEFSGSLIEKAHQRIEQLLDDAVDGAVDKAVKPIIEQGVRSFVIQQTNTFGEQKGEPVTFTEFITHRAETWLNAVVDHNGKAVDRFTSSKQTRLAHCLNEHLGFHIERMMADACKTVLEQIAPAIGTTCELKVKEATADIRRAMGHR